MSYICDAPQGLGQIHKTGDLFHITIRKKVYSDTVFGSLYEFLENMDVGVHKKNKPKRPVKAVRFKGGIGGWRMLLEGTRVEQFIVVGTHETREDGSTDLVCVEMGTGTTCVLPSSELYDWERFRAYLASFLLELQYMDTALNEIHKKLFSHVLPLDTNKLNQ